MVNLRPAVFKYLGMLIKVYIINELLMEIEDMY